MLIGIEKGLSNEELRLISTSGLYHDLGKIKISNKIVNKKGKLTDIEFEVMKLHSKLSAEYAREKGLQQEIVDAVLHHHERWDGNGYPNNLKGDDIPLFSRIISIADSFDAMTHNRVYSRAKSNDEAIEEIRRNFGKQFDPGLAEAFENVMKNEDNENIRLLRA